MKQVRVFCVALLAFAALPSWAGKGVNPSDFVHHEPDPAKMVPSCRVLSQHRCGASTAVIYYRPNVATAVTVREGRHTFFQLGEGERVLGTPFISREQKWEFTPAGNGFTLRPLAGETVVDFAAWTNRGRVLLLTLTSRKKDDPNTSGEYSKAIFMFLDGGAENAPLPSNASATEDISPLTGLPINYYYNVYYGDEKKDLPIAPAQAWDDGRMTYIRFRTPSRPVAHAVNVDGQVSMENWHTDGDILVVHRVTELPEHFELRAGGSVVCLVNVGVSRYAEPPKSGEAHLSVKGASHVR